MSSAKLKRRYNATILFVLKNCQLQDFCFYAMCKYLHNGRERNKTSQ